jgi:hypothetical protein
VKSYGVHDKESKKRHNVCEMCGIKGLQEVYTWGSFEILPKHPYYTLSICKKCAIRENGTKNKKNFNALIEKRMQRNKTKGVSNAKKEDELG